MAGDSQSDFLSCISKSSIQEIYGFLTKRQVSNIMQIRDDEGFTVLHILAKCNKLQTVEFIVRYCKDNYQTQYFKDLESWINAKTNEEELTCLHLAIEKGNLVIKS